MPLPPGNHWPISVALCLPFLEFGARLAVFPRPTPSCTERTAARPRPRGGVSGVRASHHRAAPVVYMCTVRFSIHQMTGIWVLPNVELLSTEQPKQPCSGLRADMFPFPLGHSSGVAFRTHGASVCQRPRRPPNRLPASLQPPPPPSEGGRAHLLQTRSGPSPGCCQTSTFPDVLKRTLLRVLADSWRWAPLAGHTRLRVYGSGSACVLLPRSYWIVLLFRWKSSSVFAAQPFTVAYFLLLCFFFFFPKTTFDGKNSLRVNEVCLMVFYQTFDTLAENPEELEVIKVLT